MTAPVLEPIRQLVAEWREARQELAELERAERPNITDQYGRVWIWRSKDLYAHDDTLAFPKRMIDGLNLPSPSLVDNPNYSRLCGICRSGWSSDDPTGAVA